MTRLLERERELAELSEAIEAACAGSGCFAAIEAAAGLGKTRLLQAARESGRAAGMRVLAARATELERDFPFALALQLVRAEALADLGASLRRAGRRADARPLLREALELARRCGAAGLAKRASDELAATGERVRRYTPIGVESLTPSERRVAELAASGMTNRGIAQTLFVTVKTIETHLAAVYDKLGIRSRRELPAALGDGDGTQRRGGGTGG